MVIAKGGSLTAVVIIVLSWFCVSGAWNCAVVIMVLSWFCMSGAWNCAVVIMVLLWFCMFGAVLTCSVSHKGPVPSITKNERDEF